MTDDKKVLAYIRESTHPVKPAAVAKATGLNASSVRTYIARMLDAGELVKVGGLYDVANRDTPSVGTSVAVLDAAATPSPAQLRRMGLIRIPFLNIEAGAGEPGEADGEVELDEGIVMDEQEARRRYGIPVDRLHVVRVRGESMLATLYPGDRAIVARIDTGALLQAGMIYTITGPDGVQIKRLDFVSEMRPDSRTEVDRYVVILSDNPKYQPSRLHVEAFYRQYRVVAAFLEVIRPL